MAYYVDDVPENPFEIEPPEDVELDQFDSAVAYFTTPTGEDITADSVEIGDVAVEAQFEPKSIFTEPGLWTLIVTLVSETASRRLPSIRIVVQTDDGWHTLDSARHNWSDAVHIEDDILWELLAVAKLEVVAYAPRLADGASVPVNYQKGQLMQARSLWNASKVDPSSGSIGDDSFAITPFPLDWQVKQVLRPKRAIPVVF